MEKDPVCGMLVDPLRAVGQRIAAGKTYYFCSANCLAKFDAAPERFVSGETKEKR
ncbi:MAG: YHS domain-containing protein [Nitrospirota bacterium]